ncbi:LOW QUALITY PROTEIN: hypothetical protein CRUP_033820 [Coryphaenoides rupestris]|nr:LOW QUALITY PROTEIN: hypothetical protein CRUP_033820 [Coryphaenoides rupestris]
MGSCLTVGPNEALVVSGGCCGSDNKTYMVGGWAWAWISLEIMTLQPKCEDVETAEGVAITVTGVAQVKVMTDHDLLAIACEQFLGKTVMEIKGVVLQTLEGHLRSILGTLTVEQIYQDRDQFAKLVREVASPDVGRMGIEILSFTIREAECKREMMDIKFLADTKMADSKRELELRKAAFNQEGAKEQQKIRLEEIEIEVVQRKKQISIEEKEKVLTAQAEAEKIRKIGEAEASSIEAVGKAEAEKMRLKAQAYLQSRVAAPLARTHEIVIMSGDGSRVTGEVNRLLAELPVSINALTGIDLTKIPLLQKMAQA